MLASLEQISPGDINLNWENYPFLSSSLHDDFVYDLTLNNTKTYVTETTDNNAFKNINITILPNKYVILSKENAPSIHFVIYHPTLVNAIEKLEVPIIE